MNCVLFFQMRTLKTSSQKWGKVVCQVCTCVYFCTGMSECSFQMDAQNFHSNTHFAEEHPDESDMCEAGTGI